MPHPVTKSDILIALESNAGAIAEFFSTQSDAMLFTGNSDHWGPAHHLVHLTRSSLPVQRALRSGALPAHSTGRSRPYAEVRDAAAARVASTSKDQLLEMGRVVVVTPGTSRAALIDAFASASVGLREAAATWDEVALDRHAIPHPLIGELTVREMLFFCVFHERHHLKLSRARVEATTR